MGQLLEQLAALEKNLEILLLTAEYIRRA